MSTPAHIEPSAGRRRLMAGALATAVAVAFADSSIVVLALPDLYSRFATSIVGVSWVLTSYNLVVAVGAALLAATRRLDATTLSRVGLAVFSAGALGCALSWSLPALIAFRCLQGVGAAMLLAGAIALLGTLCGSATRGLIVWTTAGTLGAAVGPALGGIATQLFDWRAIFVLQVPLALAGLAAAWMPPGRLADLPAASPLSGRRADLPAASPLSGRLADLPAASPPSGRPGAVPGNRRAAANLALALVFGALVGALFLAVLLIITVWGLAPIAGAAAVSALPVGAVAAGRLLPQLAPAVAAAAGALLLAGGLVVLALLPATSVAIVVVGLGVCGLGMGLAVSTLTRLAVRSDTRIVHDATVTTAGRHAGLVLALVLVAPLLSHDLQQGGENALLGSAQVMLNANIPIRQEVPIALGLRDALNRAPRGTVPNLAQPFNRNGAAHDVQIRQLRDSVVGTIQDALTRAFRRSLALCALLAALALIPISLARRRVRP